MPLFGEGRRLLSSWPPNDRRTGLVAAAGEAGASAAAAISAFEALIGEEGGAGVGSTIVNFVRCGRKNGRQTRQKVRQFSEEVGRFIRFVDLN